MARRLHLPRIPLRSVWRALTGPTAVALLKRLVVRVYALALLALMLAAGYLAIHYLVLTVFYPPRVPAEILQWQAKLDVAALSTDQSPGVQAPRPPIDHYHRIEQWFQPDHFNGCTTAGCHEPLPHDVRAKVPAFANFHATFLACQMCHEPSEHRPAPVRWVSSDTGAVQDPPAILKLMDYLETGKDQIESQPQAAHAIITDLLSRTLQTIGQDPLLDQLLAEMQSSQPGSPVWKHAVTILISELPQHARGEYRAKLAWAPVAAARLSQFDQMTAQARQFLDAPPGSPLRNQLQTALHSSLAKQPAPCLACHEQRPGMVDFTAAGYSSKRAQFLGHLDVAILMQKIRQGEHFYLPNLHVEGQ